MGVIDRVKKNIFGIKEKAPENVPEKTTSIETQMPSKVTEMQSTLNEVATNTPAPTINIPTPTINTQVQSTQQQPTPPQQQTIEITKPFTEELELSNTAQAKANEEKARNETTWDTAKNLVTDTFDKAKDRISNFSFHPIDNIIKSGKEAKEDQDNFQSTAVYYDKDSNDITYVDFGGVEEHMFGIDYKGNKYEAAKNQFDNLYAGLSLGVDEILNSNLDDNQKMAECTKLYSNFREEGKKLLGFYDDDVYSEGGFSGLFNSDVKSVGRRKDEYTEEELKKLNANGKPTIIDDDMFDAFFDAYENNLRYQQKKDLKRLESEAKSTSEKSENMFTYDFTDDSLDKAKSAQMGEINQVIVSELNNLVKTGQMSSFQRSVAMSTLYSAIANESSYMWQELGHAYALYKVVKAKPEAELTDGEKQILSFGANIPLLMQDYNSFLKEWVVASIYSGLDEGELTHMATYVGGLPASEYAYSKVLGHASNVLGDETDEATSADSLFQLVNQKVNYKYWQGKGSSIRQDWTNSSEAIGRIGFTVSEWSKLIAANTIEGIGAIQERLGYDPEGAYRISDYVKGDMTQLLMGDTDGDDLNRLASQFALQALDYGPELMGQVIVDRNIYKGLGLLSGSSQLRNTNKISRAVNYLNKENKFVKGVNKIYDKTSDKIKGITGWNKVEGAVGQLKDKVGGLETVTSTKEWIDKAGSAMLNVLPENRTKAILGYGWNVTKNVVADQLIDQLATYYDTEAYSTPSFYLSTGLTGLTELFFPEVLSPVFKGMVNLAGGNALTQGSTWRLATFLDSLQNGDEASKKLYKQIEERLGGISRGKMEKLSSSFGNLENVMKEAYSKLDNGGKQAISRYGKELIFDQIKKLGTMDWDSMYGKTILSLLENNKTNPADMLAYVLGATGKVEYGPFVSSIKIKGNKGIQTRILRGDYDIRYDAVDGQFRRKLNNGFTKEDITVLNGKKSGLIEGGNVNKEYFSLDPDTGKYFLTTNGAKHLELNISGYTKSMAKADAIAKGGQETKKFLNDIVKKVAEAKGISGNVIDDLANSGAYEKIVEELQKELC